MPNPKVGTVTPDVATAVKNAKSGQVTYRVDKAGIVHCTIGKANFEVNALKENLQALIADLQKAQAGELEGCVPEARHAVLDHGAGRAGGSGDAVVFLSRAVSAGSFGAGRGAFRPRPSSKTAGEGSGPLNGPPAQMVNRFSHRGAPRGVKVTVEW